MLTIRLALAALIMSAGTAALAKKIEARLPKTFVSTKIIDRIAPDPMMDDFSGSSWGIDKSPPMVARSAKKALPKTDLLPVIEPQSTARQDFIVSP